MNIKQKVKERLAEQGLISVSLIGETAAFKAGMQEAADIFYLDVLLDGKDALETWRKIVNMIEEKEVL